MPASALWRWDLAARLLLSVVIPLVGGYLLLGAPLVVVLGAVMAAALVSLASLGPDLSRRDWVAVAVVGVPVALLVGAVSARLPGAGTLLVFGLFTVHGAMVRAGLLAQMAWFPVATAGLLAAMLFPESGSLVQLLVGALLGASLAGVLMVGTPRLLRAPRLAIPPEALAVDTERLTRMVRAPAWRDWLAPLALGVMSAGLLLVTTVVTEGFKPYWAVLAFVSVLTPTSAKTRESAVETIVASLVGVALAAVVLSLGLPLAAELGLISLMGVIGALLIVRNGTVSKALLTPLPVVIAARALGADRALALQLRLAEYVVGAVLAVLAMVLAERVGQRLYRDREGADQLAG